MAACIVGGRSAASVPGYQGNAEEAQDDLLHAPAPILAQLVHPWASLKPHHHMQRPGSMATVSSCKFQSSRRTACHNSELDCVAEGLESEKLTAAGLSESQGTPTKALLAGAV